LKGGIRLRKKRRRRYNKKQYDLFLILKIALSCYLVIFGVGYMTSSTSAYLSNQSEASQMITAGIWEVPVLMNQCGEEIENVKESDNGITFDGVDKDDMPKAENEKDAASVEEIKVDGGDKDDTPKEEKHWGRFS